MTDDLVTRYRLREGDMEPSPFGLYVRHDDHAARIEQDAATIARLEGEVARSSHEMVMHMKKAMRYQARAEAAEAKLEQAVEVVADRLHGGCDCPACKPLLDFLALCGHTEETARAFLDSMGGE